MTYERRYAGVGLERRGQRGPNDANGASYTSILGANLVAMWHSQLGIATVTGNVDTWTDQIGGRVLQAPSGARRPLYQANAKFSSGKSMVKTVIATTSSLNGSGLLSMGQGQPYCITAMTFDAIGAPNALPVEFSDTGLVTSSPTLFESTSGTVLQGLAGGVITFSDTASAHTIEQGQSGGNAVISVDGVAGTPSGFASLATNRTEVNLGARPAATFPSSVSFALVLYCAAKPTAAQIAAVTALAKAEFGY